MPWVNYKGDRYGIYLDKPGIPAELEICPATTPEAAAEVVRAILAAKDPDLINVRVVVHQLSGREKEK